MPHPSDSATGAPSCSDVNRISLSSNALQAARSCFSLPQIGRICGLRLTVNRCKLSDDIERKIDDMGIEIGAENCNHQKAVAVFDSSIFKSSSAVDLAAEPQIFT